MWQQPIIEIPRADNQVVKMLIELGYLHVDEEGIHVNENIPA